MRLLALLLLALLVLGACGDDEDATTTTSSTASTTTTTDGGDDGSDLADVAVWIDGEPLGIERSCDGADGAVVVDTVDGRRVILVREGGAPAIRLFTDDETWDESGQVEMTSIGEVVRHQARVRVDDTDFDVRMEVRDDLDLPVCEELQR
ncbi:MAG: hypothetical protein AB7H43_01375 [Acidimicrobiia bacterium]